MARGTLPLYHEFGPQSGKGYEEVVAAAKGYKSSMVRINERGEVIVSVAVPVQRFRAVRGALMLQTQGADIDQMVADMYQYQTFWRGEARIMNDLGQWETFGLTANLVQVVPTPGAAVGGLAMMGLIVLRRRRGMGEA